MTQPGTGATRGSSQYLRSDMESRKVVNVCISSGVEWSASICGARVTFCDGKNVLRMVKLTEATAVPCSAGNSIGYVPGASATATGIKPCQSPLSCLKRRTVRLFGRAVAAGISQRRRTVCPSGIDAGFTVHCCALADEANSAAKSAASVCNPRCLLFRNFITVVHLGSDRQEGSPGTSRIQARHFFGLLFGLRLGSESLDLGMRQNPGVGTINSTPICVLPMKLSPRLMTRQSNSSALVGFSMWII